MAISSDFFQHSPGPLSISRAQRGLVTVPSSTTGEGKGQHTTVSGANVLWCTCPWLLEGGGTKMVWHIWFKSNFSLVWV